MVGFKCQAFFTEFNTQVFLVDTEYSNYHTTAQLSHKSELTNHRFNLTCFENNRKIHKTEKQKVTL
jgi:hypothetical protein